MKRIALAMVIAGALLGFGSAAEAHASRGLVEYPPGAPSIAVSDATPAAGGRFTATVTCTDPEGVTFTFQGQSQQVTCASGTASASFAAPSAAGTYAVTAQLAVTGVSVTTNVTVATGPTAGLPATGGGSTDNTLWIAGALLLAGAGMFLVAQQRRRQVGAAA